MATKVKRRIRLPDDMLADMRREAERQGCSLAWIVRAAVKMAMPALRRYPSAPTPRRKRKEIP